MAKPGPSPFPVHQATVNHPYFAPKVSLNEKKHGALPSLYLLRLLPRLEEPSSHHRPVRLTPHRPACSPWTAQPESSRPPMASTMAPGPFFKVAAYLLFLSSKTLLVPSVNAIFFDGDRVEGTGNLVFERLLDSRNIVKLLVSKLGGSANVCLVDVSTFKGPFAAYRKFILSVNSRGEPKRYDSDGFPASSSIDLI